MHLLVVSGTSALVSWLSTSFSVTAIQHTSDIPVLLDRLEDFDGVVFCDGDKLPSSMYGQKKHQVNQTKEGSREEKETDLYWDVLAKQLPCIGFQRGATLLSVHNAADVFQFATCHLSCHGIKTKCGQNFVAESAHNDMVDLRDFTEGEDLITHAWAEGVTKNLEKMSPIGTSAGRLITPVCNFKKEPEVWEFPQTKTLCIQGKPESFNATASYRNYCMDLIQKLLGVK